MRFEKDAWRDKTQKAADADSYLRASGWMSSGGFPVYPFLPLPVNSFDSFILRGVLHTYTG